MAKPTVTKQKNVETATDLVVTTPVPSVSFKDQVSNGKSLNKLVTEALKLYDNSNKALHMTACGCLYHALRFHNPTSLNDFYKGLAAARANDANSLRVWIGEAVQTWIDDTTGLSDQKKKGKKALTFKDGVFSVNKDMRPVEREAMADLDAFLNAVPFYTFDIKKNSEKKIGLVELLKMLKSTVERVENKADELGITIPKHIMSEANGLIMAIDKTDATVIDRAREA